MGNSFNTSHRLYNDIKTTVKSLIYKYSQWTHDDICDKLSIVYYDKLIKFGKDELTNASLSIALI
jgi:hypothetical protein